MGTSVRMVDLTPPSSSDPSSTHEGAWTSGPRMCHGTTSHTARGLLEPLNHAALRGWAILGSNQ